MIHPLSTYTQAVADEILERLSQGEPLAQICRSEGMPASRTVSDWKRAHPEFKERFDQARDDGYDVIAARTRATARGKPEEAGGDSSGDVQRDKLIIDTDLKLLAKWDPRRYGDKLAHTGPEGGAVQVSAEVTLRPTLSREDWLKLHGLG